MTNPSGVTLNEATQSLIGNLAQTEETTETEEIQETEVEEQEEELEENEDETTEEQEESEVEFQGVSIELDEGSFDLTEQEIQALAEIQAEFKADGSELTELKPSILRQRDYTQKTQQLADDRRAFQEEQAATVQRLQEQFNIAEQVIIAELQEFQNVDWENLKQTDEYQYNEKMGAMLAARTKAQQFAQVVEQQKQQQAQLQEQQDQARAEEELTKARIALPELKDEATAKQFGEAVVDYLRGVGFADEEIQLMDHRQFIILKDAIEGRKFRTTGKKAAESKINKAPKVIRKGGTKKTAAAKQTKAQKAQAQKVQQGGTVTDAADLLLKHFN